MNKRTALIAATTFGKRIPMMLLVVGMLATPTAYAALSYKITDFGPGYGINNEGEG